MRLLLPFALAVLLVPAAVGQEAEDGIRSPDLAPGQSFSYTFAEARRVDFHCHPHPWMLAAVTVLPSSGRAPMNHTVRFVEPAGQGFENWTFTPRTLTVEVGDTVTWLNAGTLVHVLQETTAEHAEHVGSVAEAGHADGDAHIEGETAGHHDAPVGDSALGWLVIAVTGGLVLAIVMRAGKP